MKCYLVIAIYNAIYDTFTIIQARRISVLIKDGILPKYSKYCNVITENLYIDEWLWFISRSFIYCLWLVPVIMIFWKQYSNNNKISRKSKLGGKLQSLNQNNKIATGINFTRETDGTMEVFTPNSSRSVSPSMSMSSDLAS